MSSSKSSPGSAQKNQTRFRKQRPQPAKPSDLRLPWCSRHQVSVSRCNEGKMKHQRLYFDSQPQIQLKEDKYEDIPLQQMNEWEDPNGHMLRLVRRVKQFPETISSIKSKPKAAPKICSPLPAAANDRRHLHSYTFPSWSKSAKKPDQQPLLGGIGGATSEKFNTGDEDEDATDLPHFSKRRTLTGSTRRSLTCGSSMSRSSEASECMNGAMLKGLPPDKEAQVKLFQDWCESRFGNMISLWRKLDKDGSMSITKAEFLKGMKDANYPGKATVLWSVLDSDATGILTINEFVPIAALHLARFKHWADEKFGSAQKAFKAFDDDHNGKMTMQEFIQGCHAEDFPVDLRASVPALFEALDHSRFGHTSITAEDLAFLDEWKCPEYLIARPDFVARTEFCDALAARHGKNYIIAWRKNMDKDGSMRVDFTEFSTAFKRAVKAGVTVPSVAIPSLYSAFDPCRRGWLTLHDWHKSSWDLLATFRRWAHDDEMKISELFKSWCSHGSNSISIGAFKSHTKTLELSLEEKEYLFEGLCLHPESWSESKGCFSHGSITKAEITFLDHWNPDDELRESQAWDEQIKNSEDHPMWDLDW